jgi:hypothetical protein
MLPQEVFNEPFLAANGLSGLDINASEWGYILRGKDHIGKEGIHPSGWNKAWEGRISILWLRQPSDLFWSPAPVCSWMANWLICKAQTLFTQQRIVP